MAHSGIASGQGSGQGSGQASGQASGQGSGQASGQASGAAHAGSGSSPLLNAALAATAEAIVGPAETPAGVVALGKPIGDDLAYLDGERRRIVLFAELAKHIHIDQPETGAAAVKYDGQVIAQIKRPSDDFLRQQLGWVHRYAELRNDRISEINIQISDILSFFGATAFLNSSARRRTLELLTITQDFVIMLEMTAKHSSWAPRPIVMDPKVMPIIQTPDHSSFPSGHAMEAFAVATVLDRLMCGGDSAAMAKGLCSNSVAFRVAHRIAVNRTIAGVHFPADSLSGALLGVALGDCIWSLASNGRKEPPRPIPFDTGAANGIFDDPVAGDFTHAKLAAHYATLVTDPGISAVVNPLWTAAWAEARAEWVDVTRPVVGSSVSDDNDKPGVTS